MKKVLFLILLCLIQLAFVAATPGDYLDIAADYGDTRGMAAYEGSLWIVDGSVLWKVEIDGSYKKISGGYPDTSDMVEMNGYFWVVDSGILWRIDLE